MDPHPARDHGGGGGTHSDRSGGDEDTFLASDPTAHGGFTGLLGGASPWPGGGPWPGVAGGSSPGGASWTGAAGRGAPGGGQWPGGDFLAYVSNTYIHYLQLSEHFGDFCRNKLISTYFQLCGREPAAFLRGCL
jgi:hypothetical protein